MAKCELCGNDYDKLFQVVMAGQSHTFDSFECPIHALAPTPIAGVRSSDMAWRPTAISFVARIAPRK